MMKDVAVYLTQGEVGVSVGGWQINAGYDLQGHPSVARSVEILREAGSQLKLLSRQFQNWLLLYFIQ